MGKKYKGEGYVMTSVPEFEFEDNGVDSIEDQAREAIYDAFNEECDTESSVHNIFYNEVN